jgi:ribonucleotide reductase beta subunit family protein with ferritin-like domain
MADKNLPRDELEALRWFRERLRHLAREYPQLTTTKHQKRLAAYFSQQTTEEETPCPESPQADHQADQEAADSSQTHGA